MRRMSDEIAAKWEANVVEQARRWPWDLAVKRAGLHAVRGCGAMRVSRCESCSTKLGDLALRFTRGEITRDEWAKRAYQGVQRHHKDWTLSEVGRYVIVRAPFYPFGDPARHRYPGEKIEAC